jgi:hypothetical protein
VLDGCRYEERLAARLSVRVKAAEVDFTARTSIGTSRVLDTILIDTSDRRGCSIAEFA